MTTRFFIAALLAAFALPRQGVAQSSIDALPVDTARETRFALSYGAAFGDYDDLNRALVGSRYPGLSDRPAFLLGVGVQGDVGRHFWLGTDVRIATPRTRRAAAGAYTRLLTTGVGILGGWRAVNAPRVGLDVFIGPEMQFVALTLRGPDTVAAANSSFVTYVAAPPDKRTLFQQQYAATAGAQLDFRSKPRVRTDGRSRRQLTIGLRVQLSQPFARSRWRGTDDRNVDDVRLGRTPAIRPLRAVATLVLTNLFGSADDRR